MEVLGVYVCVRGFVRGGTGVRKNLSEIEDLLSSHTYHLLIAPIL